MENRGCVIIGPNRTRIGEARKDEARKNKDGIATDVFKPFPNPITVTYDSREDLMILSETRLRD